jgi:putative ABC transport system permease protein
VIRVALANLRSAPGRLIATALAIVLSIAFVTGTLVLTDTIDASFADAFGGGGAADVTVRGQAPFGDDLERPGVDPALAEVIAGVAGVAAAEARYAAPVAFTGPDGAAVSNPGPPTTAVDVPTVAALATVELRDGRLPAAADEVALAAAAAEEQGVAVGDAVTLAVDGAARDLTVVGTFGGPDGAEVVDGTTALLDDATAAAELGAGGAASIAVLAVDGADVPAVRDAVALAAGDGVDVVTGDQLAAETTAAFGTVLDYITVALVGFAGVSLLVGAVLIFNTFAITVAQRTRELALLRAVGAGRGQVLTAVLVEAAVIGVAGSAAGFGLGVGLAAGLLAVLEAVGFPLPAAPLQVLALTPVVAVGLGVAVTLVSAVLPALAATRVPPVAALQAVAAPAVRRPGAARVLPALALLAAGVAALAWGLVTDPAALPAPRLAVIGAGALGVLAGTAVLTPVLARPLVGVLGAPVAAARGLQGQLARENALRNPARTAATSAALMIGLGLVSFALVFASSLRASVTATLEEQFRADLQVQGASFGPPVTLPEEVAGVVGAVDGVAVASVAREADVGVDGVAREVTAVDPATFATVLSVDVVDGDLADLEGGVAVASGVATDLGLAVGEDLPVQWRPDADPEPVRIVALYEQSGLPFGGGVGQLVVAEERLLGALPEVAPTGVLVAVADGADVADVRADVETALGDYPGAVVVDSQEVLDEVTATINRILVLIGALLALSVLIALFGIVNTLSLSILERTREIGLLRAVGMLRTQVRTMIRWEAVLVAVLGAVLGVGIGVLFGWILQLALAGDGLSTLSLPWLQLVAAFVLAGVAGVLAAVVPARRAARLDVLRALSV